MPNCRSIGPEGWEQARMSLVFYFSRRHGVGNAEDLAQETLAAILKRDDFEFERPEDFPRIVYAFARRISQSGGREWRKHAGEELDPAAPGQESSMEGMSGAALALLLREVLEIAATQLAKKEWEDLQVAAGLKFGAVPESAAEANSLRVRVHRARRKLVALTGWKDSRSA